MTFDKAEFRSRRPIGHSTITCILQRADGGAKVEGKVRFNTDAEMLAALANAGISTELLDSGRVVSVTDTQLSILGICFEG